MKNWLEIESDVQAVKATIDCTHDRSDPRYSRRACIDCNAGRSHNLALDFARLAIREYHRTALERGLSEHPDDLEKYIERALDSALEAES